MKHCINNFINISEYKTPALHMFMPVILIIKFILAFI
jgi:hypothetical protein